MIFDTLKDIVIVPDNKEVTEEVWNYITEGLKKASEVKDFSFAYDSQLPSLGSDVDEYMSKLNIDLSGIINSSSICSFTPNPLQSGQAPYGALNEKILGSSSGNEKSQSGHAYFSLITISLSPITLITTFPFNFGKYSSTRSATAFASS